MIKQTFEKLYVALKVVITISLLIILVSNCSSVSSITPEKDFPAIGTSNKQEPFTVTSTVSPMKTNTPRDNSSSVPLSSTPTQKVDLHLTRRCVSNTFSPGFIPFGSIVYQQRVHQTGILGLSSGWDIDLGETFPVMAVSPDHKRLAYTTEDPPELHIANSQGKQLQVIPIPKEWQGVIQWVDEENLLIEKFLSAPYREASAILYNLNTGFKQELLPIYPSFAVFITPNLWGNFSYSRMIFDSQFTRVVYPKSENGNGHVVLWDIEHKRSLLQLHGLPDSAVPQWLKDDSRFIVALFPKIVRDSDSKLEFDNGIDALPYKGGFDLFSVGRDGDIRRLTYFTTQFVAATELFSLSPDQQSVAFWLNLDYQLQAKSLRELAILDMNTLEASLCLSDSETPSQPIWSEDGRYIVVTINRDSLSNVILVNYKKGTASSVAWGDQYATGWLIDEQP